MIEIYTDGCAKGNPGKGGYGILMRSGNHEKRLSAGYYHTTNNRMELMAVVVAMETLKKEGLEITLTSDSQYVLNIIRKGYLRKMTHKGWRKLKNPDLWLRYYAASKNQHVTCCWVRGHTGHIENEICDALASEAAYRPTEIDHGYMDILKAKENKTGLF